MKAMFSEEYYRQFWSRFIEKVPGEDYINLEAELEKATRVYREAGIADDAIAVVIRMEAAKIANRCKELVTKEMQTVKDIEAGKASFGMVTDAQEFKARAEFRKRFEFNCLQLADFRKKYGI